MRNLMLIMLTAFLLGGCTFVKLTAGGENVAVLQANEVANCTPQGSATHTVTDKVLLRREPARVAQDLRTMARNLAAARGHDTVVAQAPPSNGSQTFDMYRCRR